LLWFERFDFLFVIWLNPHDQQQVSEVRPVQA